MNKTMLKTALLTLVIVAAVNRTQFSSILSGDDKFLGIF